jgi:hypothetical protein
MDGLRDYMFIKDLTHKNSYKTTGIGNEEAPFLGYKLNITLYDNA